MAKTILVPIDFKIESLITLKLALSDVLVSEEPSEESKVNAILMYANNLNNSIFDLLFYSASKIIRELQSTDFAEALSIIHNRYQHNINFISIELFHGYNSNALKNWVQSKKVDTIYIPKKYLLNPAKNGFNPISIIKKSKLPYKEMDWELHTSNPNNNLNSLFI